MKQMSRDELLQIPRPDVHPMVMVEYALDRLHDENRYHVSREIARGLTYEDVIGTLLSVRDALGSDPQ